MSTVYVPVRVEDELPPQHEYVHLLMENGATLTGILDSENKWAICYLDCIGINSELNPIAHWLKKVELPSEEEIKVFLGKDTPNGIGYSSKRSLIHYNETFLSGANHILNLLNSTHNEQ